MSEVKPHPTDRWEVQLRKGCLELVVLAALWQGELYGLQIVRQLATGADLVVPEGTVYPLLNRLRTEGWVQARWVPADTGHPRKYYRLTAGGRRRVRDMARSWSRLAASVDEVLAPLHEEVT